mgnify:CR=1 FL=1
MVTDVQWTFGAPVTAHGDAATVARGDVHDDFHGYLDEVRV